MKRVKKKTSEDRKKKYLISDKQMDKMRAEVSKEATNKAVLLCLGAFAENMKITEDDICTIADDIARWSTFLDQHVVKLNDLSDTIKDKTGIDFGRY